MSKYQLVIDHIQQLIERQVLRPGDSLPSLRLLSQQLSVSKNTVIRAYQQLEDVALIAPRTRSGYFLLYPEHSCESPTPRQITLGSLPLSIIHNASKPGLHPFGSANPDGRLAARQRFYRQMAKLCRQQADYPDTTSNYQATPGCPELRGQLSRRLREQVPDLQRDDLIITSGAQEALSLALRAVAQPGQIVAVESPSFYGTLQCIEALGNQVLEIPTRAASGIDLQLLKDCLAKWPIAALLVNHSFNNPRGFCSSENHKRQLLALAQQADIAVIEDDVFAELYHSGCERPLPLKALDTEGRVLLCSSFSKTLDLSSRIGWIAPGRYYEQVNYLKYVTTLASADITQRSAAAFLDDNYYERHLRASRRLYRERKLRFYQALEQHLPNCYQSVPPEGGYLSWLELPQQCDGDAIYRAAQQANIGIAPGSLFSTQGTFSHCIRLNFACFEDSSADHRALTTLGELIRQSEAGEL